MLGLALFIESLCTLIVFFAICAEVAGGRYTKCLGKTPFSVCPNGRALSVPPRPVIVCVLTVIDYAHGHPSDNLPGFQKATVWIFHEERDIEMFSQVKYLLYKLV